MKRSITRKEFLKEMGILSLLMATEGHCFWPKNKGEEKADIRGHVFKNDAPKSLWKWSIEGFHYTTNGTDVQCMVCPNRCYLAPGDRSVCRSKVNIGGKLYSLAYGNPCHKPALRFQNNLGNIKVKYLSFVQVAKDN